MLFRDIITFAETEITVDAYGEMVETAKLGEDDKPIVRRVMADKQGVKRSEFYQADTAGYKPELVFVIRSIEYKGERDLTHDGTVYRIIRHYTKDGEFTELICGKGVR
jgi:head-tail adaptor